MGGGGGEQKGTHQGGVQKRNTSLGGKRNTIWRGAKRNTLWRGKKEQNMGGGGGGQKGTQLHGRQKGTHHISAMSVLLSWQCGSVSSKGNCRLEHAPMVVSESNLRTPLTLLQRTLGSILHHGRCLLRTNQHGAVQPQREQVLVNTSVSRQPRPHAKHKRPVQAVAPWSGLLRLFCPAPKALETTRLGSASSSTPLQPTSQEIKTVFCKPKGQTPSSVGLVLSFWSSVVDKQSNKMIFCFVHPLRLVLTFHIYGIENVFTFLLGHKYCKTGWHTNKLFQFFSNTLPLEFCRRREHTW